MRSGGNSPLALGLGMKQFQWTLSLRWIFFCVLCGLHFIYHVVNLTTNKQHELDLSEDLSPYNGSWYRRAGWGFNGNFAIRIFLFASTGNKVENLAFQFSVCPQQVLPPRPTYVSSAYPSPEMNDHSALFSFHFVRRGPLWCFPRGEEFLTKLPCTLFVCGPKKLMGAHSILQLLVTDTRSKHRLVINPLVIWHPAVGHFYWLNLSSHNVSQILRGLAFHRCYSVRGHDYYVTSDSLCNQLPLSNKTLLSFTDVCQYAI